MATDKKDVIKGLECCQTGHDRNCSECPYEKHKTYSISTTTCSDILRRDLLHYVQGAESDKNNAIVNAITEFKEVVIKRICENVVAPTPSGSHIVEKCIEAINSTTFGQKDSKGETK